MFKGKLTYLLSAGAIFISILACGGSEGGGEGTSKPGSSFDMCGGIAGLTCSDPTETCVPDEGMCGVADGSGTCLQLPDACALILDPVCGCDGMTYGNACEARLAGVGIDHQGACQDTNVCGTRGAAACGQGEVCIYPESSNCGRTDLPGTCEVPPQFCAQVFDPVCGCDGQTYGNECEANAAGVSVDFKGECTSQPNECGGIAGLTCANGEYCDYDLDAMCGAADATGTCKTRPDFCAQVFDPVCGCDGQTYSNSCMAANAGVSVASLGACGSSN